MKGEIDTQWANEGRQVIEAAIRDWNESAAGSDDGWLNVAWGHRDIEDERFWKSIAKDGEPDQLGLISHASGDVEIRIYRHADGFPPRVRLTSELPSPSRLPLGAATVFNIIEIAQFHSCELSLRPNIEDQSIFIQGAKSFFFATGLTGVVLHERITDVNTTITDLQEYLKTGDIILDFWNEYWPHDNDEEVDDE